MGFIVSTKKRETVILFDYLNFLKLVVYIKSIYL